MIDDVDAELYERAPCGYLSTSPDGLLIRVNQTLLAWTGYRAADLLGRRTFASLLTPGGRIYHETHYAPMLQMQGEAHEIALELVCADGRRLPILVNSVLERGPDGKPIVIRTAVFDATERRRYESELLAAKNRAEASEQRARQLARTLQQTLMPPSLPEITGLELAVSFRPAGDGDLVGGDFYDISQLAAGDWLISVGDVTGKGTDAAVITALARHTIHSAAVRTRSPARILTNLNTILIRNATERFCTATVVRLRHVKGEWIATICNAGHPHPLLVRGGEVPVSLGRLGFLLGVDESPGFRDSRVALHGGDTLVLYTDGVTEGRRGSTFFGDDGLAASVAAHVGTAQQLCEGVLADVVEFQGGMPRDDIVILSVRVLDP
ncbi:MAG TPA: SpoIIE family protein phosphatase [Acidimicrobiales bacterium]|nr:SpoIIE family protein phosphatase [Acidimicrobiales bacterium]